MYIGEQIRTLRYKKKVTPETLAAEMGVTVGTVSKRESGAAGRTTVKQALGFNSSQRLSPHIFPEILQTLPLPSPGPKPPPLYRGSCPGNGFCPGR